MSIKRVGVIGGGQLAWMMADGAQKLGIELVVQTPSQEDPAISIADDVILAPIADATATAQLASSCDVITFENEFINLPALEKLAQQGVEFRPSLATLSPLLDKYHQRSYLREIGLPVPNFAPWEPDNQEENFGLGSSLTFPVVLKARRHGYDGQGTFIVHTRDELANYTQKLSSVELMVEQFVPFEQELAVMAARGVTGEVVIYPVVETQQENQVCHRVIAPAQISSAIRQQVKAIATKLLQKLEVVGIFGIELFLTREGQVLVNEIAPRTHNSGHYTLDTCSISQFEMHLRSVAGLPLPVPQLHCAGAVMVNLLGFEHSQSDYLAQRQQLATIPHTHVHWYGKKESRPGRKLGHVTALLHTKGVIQATEIARQIESIWYGDSNAHPMGR